MALELNESEWTAALPRYLTRFSGRACELAELERLLAQSGERLITITGTGGAGKTRLMVEALERYIGRPEAVETLFVDGASIERADELLPAISIQLGLEHLGDASSGEHLSERLAGQPMLLALDNMEHLTGAALDLAALLRACPSLRLIATSRTPLRLSGECLVALEPLATTSDRENWSPAAQLFLDRARLANTAFDRANADRVVIEAICRQLDGLPLALELAAARLRFLSPEALLLLLTNQLAVLGGGPVDINERHQTLRAAIAWSVALLSEDEQRLFRRLGIFPDSFSLDAIQAVCSSELPPNRLEAVVLDTLASLYDQGLIQRVESPISGQVRFRLLVSIREFALELLEAAGERDLLAEQLARAIQRLVTEQTAALIGPDQSKAMALLAVESAAIGAAFDWAAQRPDDDAGLSLVAGLWRFWSNRGLLLAGRGHIDRVFAGRTIEPTPLWGAALRGAAVIAELQTDWATALAWGTAAIEIWESLGDEVNLARSWVDYGNVHSSTGSLDSAREAYARAADHAARAQDERMEMVARCSVGTVALRQGNPEEADAQYALALPFMRSSGDQWLLALTLSNRAIAQCRTGQNAQALAGVRETLVLRRELGDELGVGYALLIQEEAHGDDAIGGDAANEALEIARRLGVIDLAGPALVNLAVADLRAGRFQSAGEHLGEALRNCQDAGNPVFVAEVIELIAELGASTEPLAAARLLGGTAACRTQQGIQWRGQFSARAHSLQEQLLASLGAECYWAAHAAGASVDLAELTIDALLIAQQAANPRSTPLAEPQILQSLTSRERVVLTLLAQGKSDKEIGAELFISSKTANRHVMSILAKLECRNRTAAAAMAYRLGMV